MSWPANPGIPIFRAGPEGSIPFARSFARSNPKPQVSGTTDIIAAKIMMLLPVGSERRDQILVRITHRHFAIFRTRVKPYRAYNSSGPVCR